MNSRGRRILSILLLLLYGFIITPVVLWHSHACEAAFRPGKKLPASAKQWVKAGHSCSICEHAYSSYTPADDAHEEIQVTVYHQYYRVFCTGIPRIVKLRCDTRGSPAVTPSSFFI